MTVNGITINFNSGGGTTGSALAGTLDLDVTVATVGDIMNAIGAITGVAPTIARRRHHAAYRHGREPVRHLTNAGRSERSVSRAPTTQARGGGGTPGTGQVIGSDLQPFLDKSIAGGAVTAFDDRRFAREPAVPLGQGRYARRLGRATPTPGTCSIR